MHAESTLYFYTITQREIFIIWEKIKICFNNIKIMTLKKKLNQYDKKENFLYSYIIRIKYNIMLIYKTKSKVIPNNFFYTFGYYDTVYS